MSTPVGGPLPPGDEHAISVSLPKWQDVMGWASRDPAVLATLQTGYPRFFVPHLVRRLEDSIIQWLTSRPREVLGDRLNEIKSASHSAKLFPTQPMANACRTYLLKRCDDDNDANHIQLVALMASGEHRLMQGDESEWTASPGNVIYAVLYPDALEKEAKAFWQHTGYGISSRFAKTWLDVALFVDEKDPSRQGPEDSYRLPIQEAQTAALAIRTRIAASYTSGDIQVQPDDVSLYQSGMTAITETALMLQNQLRSEKKWKLRVAVFGFLYVDTFKVLSRVFGFDYILYGHASPSEMDKFQHDLETGPQIDALFTEFPGNPLLKSLDLERVHTLSRRYGFVVVVDDTVGTSINVDLLRHCDIICTSLTKMFSGGCNVMGGSMFINPQSEHYKPLRHELRVSYDEVPLPLGWYPLDILVMEKNSVDFDRRVRIASQNAERLVEILRPHKSVQQVFYPKGSPTQHLYDKYKRDSEGYGYLFSIQFAQPKDAIAFHDALDVAKGPSLGTNFTLSCAYTLLAHYSELEWAAEHGVVEHLVRISVGLEDIDELVKVVEVALQATGGEKRCGCIRKLVKVCSCFE